MDNENNLNDFDAHTHENHTAGDGVSEKPTLDIFDSFVSQPVKDFSDETDDDLSNVLTSDENLVDEFSSTNLFSNDEKKSLFTESSLISQSRDDSLSTEQSEPLTELKPVTKIESEDTHESLVTTPSISLDNDVQKKESEQIKGETAKEDIPMESEDETPDDDNDEQMLSEEPKKGHKFLMVMGSILLVLAVAICTIYVLSVINRENRKPVIKTNDDTASSSSASQDKDNSVNEEQALAKEVSYDGFTFTKTDGYDYIVENNAMRVQGNDINFSLGLIAYDMEKLKTTYPNLKTILETVGYAVADLKVGTYSGKEIITCSIAHGGVRGVYYVIPSPDNKYVFEGVATNKDNTFDYSIIDKAVQLVNTAKVSGVATNFETKFSTSIVLSKVS